MMLKISVIVEFNQKLKLSVKYSLAINVAMWLRTVTDRGKFLVPVLNLNIDFKVFLLFALHKYIV